jgi:predicted PurR-regulated permease PerM
VFSALSAVSGLVVPLIVATVVGMLFVPLVDRLAEFLPRPVAAGLVVLGLCLVATASVAVTVAGVADQAPEIGRRLSAGIDEVGRWLQAMEVSPIDGTGLVDGLEDLWGRAAAGLAGYVGTVFSGTAAFIAGSFVAVFMLYFVLADWEVLRGWVGRHLGVADEVGAEIVDDATWSMRQYFMALTVSSLVVAMIIGATVLVLGLPLALAIAVVTFFTSYVPYVGAIFSGAFAVLIALGSGGVADAIVLVVVVLVAQNVVQAIVQTKLSQGRLSLHPIVIFGSTIAGGATLGLLGAALSTPAVALVVRVVRRIGTPGAT